MKKIVFILVLILLFSACSSNQTPDYNYNKYDGAFDEGYDEGYYEGYDEAFNESYNNGYNEGYDEGFYEGYCAGLEEIYTSFHEAERYASNNGGWHPEEAVVVIESYINNKPFYEDGSSPSKRDYELAVDSLIYFYEYYYSSKYESLY